MKKNEVINIIEIIKDNNQLFESTNGFLSLTFYKNGENTGKYEIRFKNTELKECIIRDCYSVINLYSQNNKNLIENASYNFNFRSQSKKIDDQLGKGLKLIFTPVNYENQHISFKIQFKIYDTKDFILVKLIDIIDNSKKQLSVHSISPLTIKNSSLWLTDSIHPTNLQKISWFKNGWQSWSPCKLLYGQQKDDEGPINEIYKRAFDNQDYSIKGRFYSEYCTVITELNNKNSIILGFTTLNTQFTRLIFDYQNYEKFKLLTAFGCMDGISLKNSSIYMSEELFISSKSKNLGYYGLIDYAKCVRYNLTDERKKEIPIGWCSWYYYFENISEEEMIKNLEFFKSKRDIIPIDFIQLDDGYFTKIGDYKDINSKFPHGLNWLYQQINDNHFKSGVWTAPFLAVKRSNFFKNHKDWFLKDVETNKLIKTYFNWGAFEYGLDLSNEEVLTYLSDFYEDLLYAFKKKEIQNKKTLIDFFKIDFLHTAVPIEGDYSNKNLTRAQILYNGIKIIRDAISDNAFLLGCGAPLGPCVGLVDAMRIGEDTNPTWEDTDEERIKQSKTTPSLKMCLLNVLYRSFMHKYFWINDPDCLMIRRTDTELNIDEIRLQLTIFGLSGGQLLISDDMTKLSEEEISDAKLLIPPYNPKEYDPIVVDAFISKYPSIYLLETEEIIGKRYLVAIINWNDITTSKKLNISDIIPNLSENDKSFYVYDFWNEKFLGKFKSTDAIELGELKPHSCNYINIIPIGEKLQELPILFSTNLHITQGSCEIKNFKFNKESNQLNINLELKGIRKGFLLLKLPQNKRIIKTDFEYSNINLEENLWKIFVRFKDFLSLFINFN